MRLGQWWLARGVPALLGGFAALLRPASGLRRLLRRRPRVLWGPSPIIINRDWSNAVKMHGYRSRTFASAVMPAYERADFDVVGTEFMHSRPPATRDYWVFAWALLKADVCVSFYDGGYLANTPLRDRELDLLHRAGKRVVVIPYGSDIAVSGHLGPLQAGFETHYPATISEADAIKARVDWFSRGADFAIKTLQAGYQPRFDAVWINGLAIDTERRRDSEIGYSDADGANGEVTILHAPNHRELKGTDKLVEAIEELRAGGMKVRLEVIEGRPNREVLEAMNRADVVADQLIAGFGLFAVEAMNAGRTVLSATGWMPDELREALSLAGLPVVDSDEGPLTETLRRLVVDPELRRRIGKAGREYALRRHSYEAVGAAWAEILDHVWLGRDLGPPLVLASGGPSGRPLLGSGVS